MADLTNLETKLGEVTGLAMAAQAATEKVQKLAKQDGEAELEAKLQQMHDEAAETERRCTELPDSFEGKKTAILDEARVDQGQGRRDDEDLPRRASRIRWTGSSS